jgi:hypothetical protein
LCSSRRLRPLGWGIREETEEKVGREGKGGAALPRLLLVLVRNSKSESTSEGAGEDSMEEDDGAGEADFLARPLAPVAFVALVDFFLSSGAGEGVWVRRPALGLSTR